MLIFCTVPLSHKFTCTAYPLCNQFVGGCHLKEQPFLFVFPGSSCSQFPSGNPTSATSCTGGAATRLDLSILVPLVQELFSTGIAPSTRRSYQSGTNRYLCFCKDYGITPFPTSEQPLSFFMNVLYQDGLSGSPVKGYLAAIRHSQIVLGMGDPRINAMPQLEYVVKGTRKKYSNRPGRPRLPNTPAVMSAVRLVWEQDADRFNSSMLWAASCMCFFGFLRSGEDVAPTTWSFDPAVHLCYGDVRRDSGNLHTSLPGGTPQSLQNRPIPSRGLRLPWSDWRGALPSGCNT